jgi:hypothetical protein
MVQFLMSRLSMVKWSLYTYLEQSILPETMAAIPITHAGRPEVLQPETRPVPQRQTGQVLIKVAYANVNRPDCGQRKRGYGRKGATDVAGWKYRARSLQWAQMSALEHR